MDSTSFIFDFDFLTRDDEMVFIIISVVECAGLLVVSTPAMFALGFPHTHEHQHCHLHHHTMGFPIHTYNVHTYTSLSF